MLTLDNNTHTGLLLDIILYAWYLTVSVFHAEPQTH